ncbi:MAG: hypothetical protein R6U15_06465 [Candidatus Izemoplasmatales bacterium]
MIKYIIYFNIIITLINVSIVKSQNLNGIYGGNFDFTYSNYSENEFNLNSKNKDLYLSLSPYAGKFVVDSSLLVGIKLSFEYFYQSKFYSTQQQIKYFESLIIFEPFIRYYIPNNFFIELSGGLGLGYFNVLNIPLETEDNLSYKPIKWKFGLGYRIPVNNKISIEPTICYLREDMLDYSNEYLYSTIIKKYHHRSTILLSIGIQTYF